MADPVAVRSKAKVRSRSIAGIAGSSPAGVMDVHLLCFVSSGLWDGLIIQAEESSQVLCV